MSATQQIPSNPYALRLYKMGLENQVLVERCLNLGLVREAKELQYIDGRLRNVLYKATFDFVDAVAQGRTLFVGEGNLSFALSLAKMQKVFANRLVATTFENLDEMSADAIANAAALRSEGATILNGVDAAYLSAALGSWQFDTIVFQFPHAGSREPIEGHNPNYILVRDFLVSAAKQLRLSGQVLITTVDSPHYRGAFQFEMAAEEAGFKPPEQYRFYPSKFPGYEHTMTHQSGSALDRHDAFATWVFRK